LLSYSSLELALALQLFPQQLLQVLQQQVLS
jgi:hypothetical protein